MLLVVHILFIKKTANFEHSRIVSVTTIKTFIQYSIPFHDNAKCQ